MSTRRSLAVLLFALSAQLVWGAWRPPGHAQAAALPAAPAAGWLRVLSGGDELAMSRFLMLWLQAFDAGPGGGLPLRALDYEGLRGWLETIADLDPRSRYPLLAASQVYAAVDDPARVRVMLGFVHAQFMREPDRNWPWLAQAAITARHRLADLPLALRYARDLRENTSPGTLPPWAAQLDAWFSQDMNELDAARAVIGALIESGRIRDPNELRLLEKRLQALEAQPPVGGVDKN